MNPNVRIFGGLLICAILAVLIVLFVKKPAKVAPIDPTKNETSDATIDGNPKKNTPRFLDHSLLIGRDEPNEPREIDTVMTTRKGDVIYQAFVRYMPKPVPLTEVPGASQLIELFEKQDRGLPDKVVRIDQETEMALDSLGEPLRSVSCCRFYVHPVDGRVIAYDLAQTTGNQPQRFRGHITRDGVAVEVCRGDMIIDRHEIPFSTPNTFIPVDMRFIHRNFTEKRQADVDARMPSRGSIFIPDVMQSVSLFVKPLEPRLVAVQATNHECAGYEVLVVSQSNDGTQSKQEMWFDKTSGELVRREDFEPSLSAGETPVTERSAGAEIFSKVRQLVVRPPEVPFRPVPFDLQTPLLYTIHIQKQDQDSGRVRLRFGTTESGQPTTTATVDLVGNGSRRTEKAVTIYDDKWMPVGYRVEGMEAGQDKSDYTITAQLGGGTINIRQIRKTETPKTSTQTFEPTESPLAEGEWKNPLQRVPVSDEEAKAEFERNEQPARKTDYAFSRPLLPGTFLWDFNRVEHMALIASRLPLPPLSAEGERARSVYQKAALFSVRQNRSAVLLFEIYPEPKPELTPRQRRRLSPVDLAEPQLYIAKAAGALLPCQMLLAADGRMLELTLKYGSGEVTYTLDDPIMRRRAERAKKKQIQEGPQLIRPPWW